MKIFITGQCSTKECESCFNCSPAQEKDDFMRVLWSQGPDDSLSDTVTLPKYREVPESAVAEFEEELNLLVRRHLHREFGYAPILGWPVLSSDNMQAICRRLDGIKNEDDLKDIVPNRSVRMEILALVYDFFRDIPKQYCDLTVTQNRASQISCTDQVYNQFIVDGETDVDKPEEDFDITEYDF